MAFLKKKGTLLSLIVILTLTCFMIASTSGFVYAQKQEQYSLIAKWDILRKSNVQPSPLSYGLSVDSKTGDVYAKDAVDDVQVFELTPSSPATGTTTPSQATINTTGNFLTYDNSTMGVKIQYPSDWKKVESGNNSVRFLSRPPENSSDRFTSELAISAFPSHNMSLGEVTSNAINQHTKSLTNFNLLNLQGTNIEGGLGEIGLVYTYVNDTSGITIKGIDIHTLKGDKVYVIQYLVEAAKHTDYLPTIQKMIDSFEIIG